MRTLALTLLLVGLPCLIPLATAAERTSTRRYSSYDARRTITTRLDAAPISFGQARRIVHEARRRLGVDFRLKWKSGVEYIGHEQGKPIKVTRGIAKKRGLTEDGLMLMLAHEAAHARGIREEAKADYWAARHGLRKLWGKRKLSRTDEKRALEAAHALLKATHKESFDARPIRRRTIEINAAGYPTLQSRWDLSVAGIFGHPIPKVAKRAPYADPVYLDRKQAAALLGVSQAWLAKRARKGDGPMELDLGDGKPTYVKSNLEEFKKNQTER